jgi:hypothetical protein
MRRAMLAGAMMSKFAGSYPFAMGSRQPVQLTSESQVREWLPDLEKAFRMLDSLLVGGRNLLPAWMDWLDQEEPVGTRIEIFPTAIRRLLPKPALRAMEGGFHRSVRICGPHSMRPRDRIGNARGGCSYRSISLAASRRMAANRCRAASDRGLRLWGCVADGASRRVISRIGLGASSCLRCFAAGRALVGGEVA